MTRWFVGVKADGVRQIFSEATGTYPTAEVLGFAEVCGPYRSKQAAAKAARGKPTMARTAPRNRRRS